LTFQKNKGSWSQVIEMKLRGREGAVIVAVDVQSMRPLEGMLTFYSVLSRQL
jgi:23S rRNA U2552 (ribose-2'-O)-methylase RlmE/FtsJ